MNDKDIERANRKLAFLLIKYALIWLIVILLYGALTALMIRSCC